jgi:hypothetical protein
MGIAPLMYHSQRHDCRELVGRDQKEAVPPLDRSEPRREWRIVQSLESPEGLLAITPEREKDSLDLM